MKIVALNIETVALEDRIADLPEPEVKLGNTKDPQKIKEKIESVKAEQRSRMALDPLWASIACITLALRKTPEAEPTIVTHFANTVGGEDKLLAWVWKQLGNVERLVTFNGAKFDIPFMLRRSIVNRVPACVPIECNKYRLDTLHGAHVDLMQFLHQGEPGQFDNETSPLSLSRTLSYYVKQLLGVDFPYADVDQSRFAEMLAAGDQKTIAGICEWNTLHTLLLYERINF